MDRVLLQPQPAVARHRLGHVDQQRVRHGVAAVLQQRVDDLLGVVAGGPGVPQPERGQPVGVDVLGRPLELGERRDRLAAVGGALVVDLEQQRLVGLDDEGSVVIHGHRSAVIAVGSGRDRPSAGRGRPRRWRARSSGRSSSGATGWARCRRRRWCTARPRRCRAGGARGRRPGWPGRAAPRRRAARRPTGSSTAAWMCRCSGSWLEICGRDRVPHHQLVDPVDDGLRVVGGRGLEDRPQLALELPQQHAVAVGALGTQPLAVGEMGRSASTSVIAALSSPAERSA